MKKYYDLQDGTWTWDTWEGVWTRPGKTKQNPPKHTELAQVATKTDSTWFGVLKDIFVNCRAFPGWANIYESHDDEDKQYFMRLEQFYESGKLKVKLPEFLAA